MESKFKSAVDFQAGPAIDPRPLSKLKTFLLNLVKKKSRKKPTQILEEGKEITSDLGKMTKGGGK